MKETPVPLEEELKEKKETTKRKDGTILRGSWIHARSMEEELERENKLWFCSGDSHHKIYTSRCSTVIPKKKILMSFFHSDW
jgi:hypothetical protein